MKNKHASRKPIIIPLIVVLFVSVACSLGTVIKNDDNESAQIQQTLVSLQQTQNALDDRLKVEPLQPTEEMEFIEPTPSDKTSPEEPDLLYEGISFSFHPSLAGGVDANTIDEQYFGEDYMPGDNFPTYFEFKLTAYALPDHFHEPFIRVFPVEDYRAISIYAGNIIDSLKQTLISRPAGGSSSSFPFLPMWNAAQLFSAYVNYFDFQNGSGVRFLTMYGQALYPVDNSNLFYTYQGITSDGRYYLSAVLPISHPGLPDKGQVNDWYAFDEGWNTYITDTIAWMESQNGSSFSPSIDQLDAMMASFNIDR